jgi:hypothetical protein
VFAACLDTILTAIEITGHDPIRFSCP